jgi:hypothetical protein
LIVTEKQQKRSRILARGSQKGAASWQKVARVMMTIATPCNGRMIVKQAAQSREAIRVPAIRGAKTKV